MEENKKNTRRRVQVEDETRKKEDYCMVQLVMRRLDRLEASTMTWLILFLRLSPEFGLPFTGDGAPSRSEVDEVSPPGPMAR